MSDLPIIDLAGLRQGGEAGLVATAAEIGAACRGAGFFFVVNHGLPAGLTAEAFAMTRAFFALSPEAKAKLGRAHVGGNRGYSELGSESLNPERGRDVKEAFNIGLELRPDDPGLETEPYRALNAWPDLPGFRATMLAYFDACMALGLDLHRAFARDLGLPDDHFHPMLARPMATLRLLHYPKAPLGDIGAGEHTDYGNITLLAVDGVAGLEVKRRDGGWIEAPTIQGALIVNIGDCLMRWTNDVYVSTPHRVVSQGTAERYSIPFFLDPNPFARIEAIPSCVPAGEQPKHPPILGHEYLTGRLNATYLGT